MLEAQDRTQDSGVHLYNEGDTIHFVSDKQSMGAGGIRFKESSKGTLVSAYFPNLESLVRNYFPTVIAMTSLEALLDVISTALFLPHNYH